jgi:hypothetical protein
MKQIEYKGGYKYQLCADWMGYVGIKNYHIHVPYIVLKDGVLLIEKGYAWDGPSGPAIDTPNFMRGSLVHDALYQLIRMRELPTFCRRQADEVLRDICIEDGMSKIRAWWVFFAVQTFAQRAADPENAKEVRKAP